MCTCSESHQVCFCYWNTPPTTYHIPEMPYWGAGKAWRQGKPEQRKPRRRALISAAWQHVIDFEDWVLPIHTISYGQTDVRYGFHRLRRWGDQPPETTQECLTSIE